MPNSYAQTYFPVLIQIFIAIAVAGGMIGASALLGRHVRDAIKYSPYDNVKAQNYPNMLVKVSLNDSQVPFWEGTKFVARLRATKTDKNTIILKANMGAGHGGSSGRYDALHETAFNYAYMLTQMGITK